MIAAAVATYIAALDLDWTFGVQGSSVHIDEMPSSPDRCVYITPTTPDPQLSKRASDYRNLSLLIRGERGDARSCEADAMAIYDALNCLDNVVLDDGGPDEVQLIGCTALQSGPTYLGYDANGRPRFSLNFRLRILSPTTNRS